MMPAALMIARCEQFTGHAYDMMKVEEERGGLAARAIVFSKPSCGKQPKPYETAGATKCLAPCKLHAKSLAIRKYCKFLSHSRRYPGTRCLHNHNYSLYLVACVQSVAMFGAELWWKGGNVRGTTGRVEELQLLVNQQARATTGAFRTTNLGALSMESGLRPASNQLENRQRRFGLRLLSLPQGDEARKVVIGSSTAIGRRLKTALNRTWTSTEQTVLPEDAEPLNAELIQEDREEAKREAEKERLGLVMFTDGSRRTGLLDTRWHGGTA